MFCNYMGEKKSPIMMALHLAALIILVLALWYHSLIWIIIVLVLMILGHGLKAMKKKAPKASVKKKRR